MTTASCILEIALPVPLRRVFDYLPPADAAFPPEPGTRVCVPFGSRQLVGIVVGSKSRSEVPGERLKQAIAYPDDAGPLLDASRMQLLTWASDYYHYPIGEAFHTALPASFYKNRPSKSPTRKGWQLSVYGKGLPENALSRSPRQAEALAFIRRQPGLSTTQLEQAGLSAAAIRALKGKKLLENCPLATASNDGLPDTQADQKHSSPETPLTPTDEQARVIEALRTSEGFSASLLEGVTGSGKTEVYLQAIAHTLAEGKQVVVLVPEIGLTPQTLSRFTRRFNCRIRAYHSGLGERERVNIWHAASRGEVDILIGTRSAIFLPVKKPGLYIVDEEHDASFKQQDNFRYSARDLAVVRARTENCPVLLGSATPSLETLKNALSGRYRHFRLQQRAGGASLPTFDIVDTRTASLEQGFSPRLLRHIRDTLQAGQQVLVFLNRRGFAPALICPDCHWIATCPDCETRLTVHKQQNLLRCHHCDFRRRLPATCPSCHHPAPDFIGQGTQRCESFLQSAFPDVPTLRIDRDNVKTEKDWMALNRRIKTGEPMILLGTQMLAKGHHYPDVSLVAILDADQGFFSTDFRSAERTAQLITQVSGRAGRVSSRPGTVVIQTQFAEHPLIRTLAEQGYHPLALELLKERQLMGLPPYSCQAVFRAEARQAEKARQWLEETRKKLEPFAANIQLIGPLPAMAEKRAGYFRYELGLWSKARTPLHQALASTLPAIESSANGSGFRWHLDIDPYFY